MFKLFKEQETELRNTTVENTTYKDELDNPPVPVNEPSVISAGTTILGEIRSESDLVILGEVKGDITSSRNVTVSGGKVTGLVKGENISLDKGANVHGELRSKNAVRVCDHSDLVGDITADMVDISAKVNGDIKCNGFLHLSPESRLVGDISSAELSIDRGAYFEGKVTPVYKRSKLS